MVPRDSFLLHICLLALLFIIWAEVSRDYFNPRLEEEQQVFLEASVTEEWKPIALNNCLTDFYDLTNGWEIYIGVKIHPFGCDSLGKVNRKQGVMLSTLSTLACHWGVNMLHETESSVALFHCSGAIGASRGQWSREMNTTIQVETGPRDIWPKTFKEHSQSEITEIDEEYRRLEEVCLSNWRGYRGQEVDHTRCTSLFELGLPVTHDTHLFRMHVLHTACMLQAQLVSLETLYSSLLQVVIWRCPWNMAEAAQWPSSSVDILVHLDT